MMPRKVAVFLTVASITCAIPLRFIAVGATSLKSPVSERRSAESSVTSAIFSERLIKRAPSSSASGDGLRHQKETAKQKARREKAALQRQQTQQRAAADLVNPITDAQMTDKIRDKINEHHAGLYKLHRDDRREGHTRPLNKWMGRSEALLNKDQSALLGVYEYYLGREASDSEKQAKRHRKKEYYRSKLDSDPETPAHVPGTPDGGHYYSDIPSTPALDPSQYYAGNWGGDGHDYD